METEDFRKSSTEMTPEQFKDRMEAISQDFGGDPEAAHARADHLLIECLRALGYGAGCDIFEAIDRWYA